MGSVGVFESIALRDRQMRTHQHTETLSLVTLAQYKQAHKRTFVRSLEESRIVRFFPSFCCCLVQCSLSLTLYVYACVCVCATIALALSVCVCVHDCIGFETNQRNTYIHYKLRHLT